MRVAGDKRGKTRASKSELQLIGSVFTSDWLKKSRELF